jgi:lysophospholipase L1-like esterase
MKRARTTKRRLVTTGILVIGGALASIVATHRPSAGASVPIPRSVIVVGDSLTALNISTDERSLKAHGVPSWYLNAQTGRSSVFDMPTSYGVLKSGLASIVDLKAAGYTAPLWIVELGTNDANGLGGCGCDEIALATSRITTIMRAIGPDAKVGWVSVRNGHYPTSSQVWNAALAGAAKVDPRMFIVDWYSLSNDHGEWFNDGIHPSQSGAPQLAELIATAVAFHLPAPVLPTTSIAGVGGLATATATAVRIRPGANSNGGLTTADRCGSITAPVGPGSSGAPVRSVQCSLALIGRYSGQIDGVFGASTANAVSAFTHFLGVGGGTTVTMTVGHGLGIWNY